jgi:hypothetical protein
MTYHKPVFLPILLLPAQLKLKRQAQLTSTHSARSPLTTAPSSPLKALDPTPYKRLLYSAFALRSLPMSSFRPGYLPSLVPYAYISFLLWDSSDLARRPSETYQRSKLGKRGSRSNQHRSRRLDGQMWLGRCPSCFRRVSNVRELQV